MGPRRVYDPFIFILAYLVAIPVEAVTVPIVCPTNKIAPHRRRITNWDYGKARTFGAYYDLLVPNRPQFQNDPNDAPPLNDLQEKPQEDDPDDCGEIEDYDENDLSSLTQQGQRQRQGRDKNNKFLFGWFIRPPPIYPGPPPIYPAQTSTARPQEVVKPTHSPIRPPYYFSGGYFDMNEYKPPIYLDPSDSIKPIYENSVDMQTPATSYNPNLVGVPSGQIVGASPLRPPTRDTVATTQMPIQNRSPRYYREGTTYKPFYPSRIPLTTRKPIMYPIRGQRPRNVNSNGILGSFVDLLFK